MRGALVARSAEPAPAAEIVEPKPLEAKPLEFKPAEAKTEIVAPLVRQAVREAPPMSIENVRVPPLATVAAPVLPPPSEVASAPAPQLEKVRVDDSHPVPPGAIPEQTAADTPPPEGRSRIGELIARIPLANRLLDR